MCALTKKLAGQGYRLKCQENGKEKDKFKSIKKLEQMWMDH